MPNSDTPGMRIRRLREAMEISPDELSDLTGSDGPSADTIARIEAGLVRPFGLFLQYIAEALDVTANYILSGRADPEDEIATFAELEFLGAEQQRGFVTFAREACFRNRNINYEELRVLKREYLRRQGR